MAAPLIFDRALVRQRRKRAAPRFGDFDFLKREVAAGIVDRLQAIRRDFHVGLDLGCHNGVLSREVIERRGVQRMIACDLDQRFAKRAGAIGVVADEEALPFKAASFDLVVSALSLHHVNDLPGALIQIRRALKPDGLFMASLYGVGTLADLSEALIAAEVGAKGGAAPRIGPFLDARDGAGLLQRAGFALPVADVDTIRVDYAEPMALLADLRGMGETCALVERSRTPLTRAVLGEALARFAQTARRHDGRFEARFEIVTLTGWAPHESQQQPLRPGQGQIPLGQALKNVGSTIASTT